MPTQRASRPNKQKVDSPYSFKNHTLSPSEQVWLKFALERGQTFDPRAARVVLFDKLSPGFEPRNIDRRLYVHPRLKLLGRWLLSPEDPRYARMDAFISGVRHLIVKNPGTTQIAVEDILSSSALKIWEIHDVLDDLSEISSHYNLSPFFNGIYAKADGPISINLDSDSAYDQYLVYAGLDDLFERAYQRGRLDFGQTVHSQLPLHPLAQQFHIQSSEPETPHKARQEHAFILMAMDPDKPELQDIYITMKEVCRAFGVKAYRADEIQHQESITQIVLEQIHRADLLIADLSYERPNVYYEIGFSHALGKKPILYRRRGTALHFDLSVHNVPEYRNNFELRDLLWQRLEAVLGRTASRTTLDQQAKQRLRRKDLKGREIP